MLDTLTYAANAAECELESAVTFEYRAYKLRRTDPVVQIAWGALESCGFAPVLAATGGGADAHIFNVELTPDYNWPHRNHFHLEVTPKVKWFLVH